MGREWHPDPFNPSQSRKEGGSKDDGQSLVRGLFTPLTGPVELPLWVGRTSDPERPLYSMYRWGLQMNDQRQSNPLDPAIEDLRAKRDLIDGALRVLESIRDGSFMTGVSLPTLPTGASLAGPASPPMLTPAEIPPGTFLGMSTVEAVTKLLTLRKRTMTAQEISVDLPAGGFHLKGETPANTITSVLHRSFTNGGDIVRVGRGQWGLQEWYPNQRFNRKASEE